MVQRPLQISVISTYTYCATAYSWKHKPCMIGNLMVRDQFEEAYEPAGASSLIAGFIAQSAK